MIKEIGSIYPLKDLDAEKPTSIPTFIGNRVLFSLCREALSEVALLNNNVNKVVLLPAYTCQTVITPFKELGWETIFYPIKKNLRIDTCELVCLFKKFQPSLIVVHPFFGMDLNEDEENTLSLLVAQNIKVVIDLTQCIFTKKEYSYCEYKVGSYRKWFPIPDGAYLKCKEATQGPTLYNTEFSDLYSWAMYLRGLYFDTGDKNLKDISIALSKKAERNVESNISAHKISNISLTLISKEDSEWNVKKRLQNYSILQKSVINRYGITKVSCDENLITTAPLYFTVYAENRKELQRILAKNSVYAPILWPVEDRRVLVSSEVEYIYDHILAIPCDQRYSEKDMEKIANIINNFNNE